MSTATLGNHTSTTVTASHVALAEHAPAANDLDSYLTDRLRAMAALSPGHSDHTRLRDDVICACLPVVRRLAARFYGRGEAPDDLTQVATIGLIKAVDRYDTTRETPFLSYAAPTIIGEIKRHFRDKGWSVRVSRPIQELYLDINRVLPELAQDLGRSPRIADIAVHLGVPETDVIRGLEAGHAYTSRSLSAPIGGDEASASLADLLGDTDPDLESAADRTTLHELLRALPDRERQILGLRFFGNLTQNEIAERIGVSQMHVSRLITRALKDLRERLVADE